MSRRRTARTTVRTIVLAATVTALVACSGSDAVDPTTTTVADTLPADLTVTADAPFPAERCEANRAAGPIVYLSSFDFAASASIVDVLVAESKGYYDELCLDVQLTPSFSVSNYPLIAANEAQFSSGGSFSEMADFAGENDAGFVALAVEGRTGIDALITKDGEAPTLESVRGRKIGVKGRITASVKAMLAKAGLVEGTDYSTVLLEGYDPLVHIEVPDIVGFPGYKSNEPVQLEAAGIPVKVYDPSDMDIPGSFGVLYTNSTFLAEFPTAAEDFMRATMRGLADAIADPAGAAAIAMEAINANGNGMYLSPEGETARWKVEAALVADSVTADAPLGMPLLDQLVAEVTTYTEIGLFDEVPDAASMIDTSVLRTVYAADGSVIWPKG